MIRTTATLAIEAAAGDGNPRVTIKAYSGGLMRVGGYGAVALEFSGIQLPESLPLLVDHDASIDGVVGSGKPAIRDGALFVDGVIAADTVAGQKLLALHKAGVKFQASIGAEPITSQYTREATVNGKLIKADFTHVTKAILKEVSVLPIGADATTAVKIAAKGHSAMEPTNTLDPVQAERDRVKMILATCRGEWGAQAPRVAELQAKALDGEIDMATLNGQLLEIVRASRPSTGITTTGARPEVSPRLVLAAAAAMHIGAPAEKWFGAQAAQAGADLRANNLIDLCAAALRLEHHDVPRDRSEMIRAAFSSTDGLPVALGNLLEKSAADAFSTTGGVWGTICRRRTVKTFHEHKVARVLLSGGFEPVAEAGELKHVSLQETSKAVKAQTEGALLVLTRQDIINDDLGVLADGAAAMGREGARVMSDRFVQTLLANAGNHYHANNSNLGTGADSALLVASLQTAIAALAKRVDATGRTIDLRPRFLLVPPELEFPGRQILTSSELWRYTAAASDQRPSGNPFLSSGLELLVEPRLSNASFAGYSASAWYVFSDAINGAVNVALLDGKESPTVEQVPTESNTLGIGWRGYIDFGFALGETVASHKMAGA